MKRLRFPRCVLLISSLVALAVAAKAPLSAQTDKDANPPTQAPALRLQGEEPTSLVAIIHQGQSLQGDGLGPYRDNTNGSRVNKLMALNLWVWKYVDELSNRPYPKANKPRERYLMFDLSRPVEGSGAVKLASGKDYLARFHVFWNYGQPEPGASVAKLHSMTDIPIGTSVESERVEMWVLIGGVQHVLQMGPWAMGKFSARASIDGRGTTKAAITRQTENSWRIKAADNSIARLWNYSDIQHPIDQGLYFFGFDVEFAALHDNAPGLTSRAGVPNP